MKEFNVFKIKYIRVFLTLATLILHSCNSDDDSSESRQIEPEIVLDYADRVINSDDNFVRNTIQVGPSSDEFFSYIDEGVGDPILFLHGAPAYSYLWRNVIPHLSDNARVIALDWMGSGDSGTSPGGDYSYLKQFEYLESFIDQLGLTNITLVLHDWSTITALPYAHQNQDKIKAIASFETVYFPIPSVDTMPELAQQFIGPEGERMIVDENAFMEIMLPNFSVRNLTNTENENYRRRWETRENRFALLAVPKGLPIAGEPVNLWEQFGAASTWFSQTSLNVPKFFTYSIEGPGVLVTNDIIDPNTGSTMIDFVTSFPNTTVTPVFGSSLHFLQEDNPHDLGIALSNWYDSL